MLIGAKIVTDTLMLVIVVYTIAAFIVGVKMRALQLKCSEAERLYNVAIHDLYDARFQLLNLTAQDGNGALGYVYVLKSDSGHYKIGKTSDPKNRRETFGVKLPMEVEYIVLIQSHGYHQLEAKLHQQFKHKRVNGEWFNLSETDLMLLEKFPGNTITAA